MNKLIKFINIIKSGLLYPLLKYNVAASVEHRYVLLLFKCQHFIDIGANCGQFSLMARKCFPNARIDSFEPLLQPCKRFKSLFKTDSNIHLHRFAIGPKQDETKMHVSKRNDSSSLLPIGEKQSEIFPGTEESHMQNITVLPLDQVISINDLIPPVFVKIDVQGYELEALYGCQSLFDKINYIYCECSFVELYKGQALTHEIIDFLNQNGFKLVGVYNVHYNKSGIAIQADFLFSS